MNDQRSDSYQPRDRVDHSKRCTRGGEGSICGGRVFGGDDLEEGDVEERRVRIVWRGTEGSQESICAFKLAKMCVFGITLLYPMRRRFKSSACRSGRNTVASNTGHTVHSGK